MPSEDYNPPQLAADSLDPDDPEYSLLMPDKRKALDAIKVNLRTTAPQLATTSGLSIDSATYWLNKIAGETGARLDVAKDGTVYYAFKPNFAGIYKLRGRRKAVLLAGAFLFKLLYWVVRVSFGVALVLSVLTIVVLFVALIFIALASIFEGGGGHSGSHDFGGGHSDSGGGGGGGGSGFFDLHFLTDILSWDYSPSHTTYYNSLPSSQRDRYTDFIQKHPKGNFFLECFSFLFGDGAPNSNLQKIRWQNIAALLQSNEGVVSAEQLAPFLDGDTSDSGMVMSALAQFNGRPEVTKSGFIVYVFPDYLSYSPGDKIILEGKDGYLKEDRWKFSNFPPMVLTNVLMLAIFNFCGSWWLFKHIATINLLHNIAALIDVLLTYSIVLLLIPAVRYVVLAVLNARIEDRNARRKAAYDLVSQPQGEVLKELKEAREIRDEQLTLLKSDKGIVYTTDKDSLEQQFI